MHGHAGVRSRGTNYIVQQISFFFSKHRFGRFKYPVDSLSASAGVVPTAPVVRDRTCWPLLNWDTVTDILGNQLANEFLPRVPAAVGPRTVGQMPLRTVLQFGGLMCALAQAGLLA